MEFITKDGHTFPLTPKHPALSSKILNINTESQLLKTSRIKHLHDFAKRRKNSYEKLYNFTKKQSSKFSDKQKQNKSKKESERLSKINKMQVIYFRIIENTRYSNERRLMLLHSLKQEYKKDLKLDKYLSSESDAYITNLKIQTNQNQSNTSKSPSDLHDNTSKSPSDLHYNTSKSPSDLHDNTSQTAFPTRQGEFLDVGEDSNLTPDDILRLQSAGVIDPKIQIPEDDE